MVLLYELTIDIGLSTGSITLSTLFELEHTIKEATLIPMVLGNLQEATFLHTVQLCSTA